MSQLVKLIKGDTTLVIKTVRVDKTVGVGGGVTALSVVNIDDPSLELNVMSGTTKGELILVYQMTTGTDQWTMYAFDDADSNSENVPYRVDGLIGMWTATAGKFTNSASAIGTPGEMDLFDNTTRKIALAARVTEHMSTGVTTFDGNAVSGPSTVLVGKGTGRIVDNHTDPSNPTVKEISWSQVDLTIDVLGPGTVITFIFVDPNGVVQQQTATPTDLQIKENLFLGRLATLGNQIAGSVENPRVLASVALQVADLFDGIGTININVIVTNGGTDLTIATLGGRLLSRGQMFNSTVAGRADPNGVLIAEANPLAFRYLTSTTGDPTVVTNIDPANYDVGGVVTPIPGSTNRATNQRIWMFPNGVTLPQYGPEFYTSLDDAVAGLSSEVFIESPSVPAGAGILIAVLAVIKGATNLSDDAQAKFLTANKFGDI